MKKLFIISFLTFFSISAIAETNLRCEFLNTATFGDHGYDLVGRAPIIKISYQEGSKLFLNGLRPSGEVIYGDDTINFTDIRNGFRDEHRIDKKFLTYTKRVFKKLVKDIIDGEIVYEGSEYRYMDEYICTKIN